MDNEIRPGFIQLYSGGMIDPLDPDPADVKIEDIAHGLARKCRFNGQVKDYYSVSEHSILVAGLVPPEYALAGLMHDASEAYLPDVGRPIKHKLIGFAEIEHRMMQAIITGLDLKFPDDWEAVVKISDNAIVYYEADEFCTLGSKAWGNQFGERDPDIEPWFMHMQHYEAEDAFLGAYENLRRG